MWIKGTKKEMWSSLWHIRTTNKYHRPMTAAVHATPNICKPTASPRRINDSRVIPDFSALCKPEL